MTPREIVKGNLNQSGPERIGFAYNGDRLNDMWGCGIAPSGRYTPRKWTEGQVEYSDDEWGNIWHRIVGMSAGGEIYKPAIEDWAQLKDYRLPDFDNPKRFEGVPGVFADPKAKDKYRLGWLPGFPFALCRYLRKMEIYFQDLVLERDHIDELHDRVTTMLEGMIREWGRVGADGFIFCEDWGIQDRLLISPAMWREIFKPLFRRLCDTAHQAGLDVLMHSCGYNWDILDDLAEVGVNAFQFDQPGLYGLERLAENLRRNKVCLFAPVDIQKVLPTGNRELIVSEAKKMVKLFGGKSGGLMVKNYGDLAGIGVQPEWDRWGYETFVEMKDLRRV